VCASGGRSRRSTEVKLWIRIWCLFYKLAVSMSWHCGAAFPAPARAAEMARVSAVLPLPACIWLVGKFARRLSPLCP
jgi:hypothetical protein